MGVSYGRAVAKIVCALSFLLCEPFLNSLSWSAWVEGILRDWGYDTLVQYAACPCLLFLLFLFGERAEAGDGVQFDSDYSGGDDASTFFFFLGECSEGKWGMIEHGILLTSVGYV